MYARNPSGGGKEQTSIALRLLTTAIGFSQQMRSQQIDFPLSPVLRAATEKCLTILEKCRIRARTAGGDWRRSRTIRRRNSLNRSAHGRIGLWPTRKYNRINGDFGLWGRGQLCPKICSESQLNYTWGNLAPALREPVAKISQTPAQHPTPITDHWKLLSVQRPL